LQQSYDPCGRLQSQLAGKNKQLSAHEKLAEISRKYNWDKSGRLIGVKDNKRGASSNHYDPRDQISRITRTTGLDKQISEQYSYDSLMNLVESNGRHHQYENGEVKSIGRSSYRHDSRGRLVEKRVVKHAFRPKTWHYCWDDFDRLTETHTPDGAIWRYTYDAFGRRIKKECVKAGNSGKKSIVSYLWQGATLAEEHRTTSETTEVSRWHFEPGTFNPLAKETSGNFYPIVTDHLGTPKELFDTEGNCVWQAEQSLWGETTVAWQKMQQPGSFKPLVDCNLRFQNQWEDEESGLHYNLNRYYDPDSGQYLSPDPIGLEGGLRTHGYVHDPMQWVDPLGLAACGTKKPIVLGETMPKRVSPVAQKLGAHTFKPRSNNPARWKANQKRWINDQMNSGRDMYDIGTDRLRPTRSDYYKIERTELKKAGYERVYQRRIKVDVDGTEKEFRLYKWVKM
jgi:RHS repeat-associated protein